MNTYHAQITPPSLSVSRSSSTRSVSVCSQEARWPMKGCLQPLTRRARSPSTARRALSLTLLLYASVISALSITGCTVFREGGGETGGETGGEGGAIVGPGGGHSEMGPPLEIDVLILATFDQSPIADYYKSVIEEALDQLTLLEIHARKVGIAPMYKRINDEVPLLYGLNDPEAEFDQIADVLTYYTQMEGLLRLDDESDFDGENLLALGARLGRSAIYHPISAAEGSQYYFEEPRDGLLVMWINPIKRRCGLADCLGGELEGRLIERTPEGLASWVNFGGAQNIAAHKIFHLFVGTQEGVDEDDFFSTCENTPGLPARVLDYIEPSPISLYSQLTTALDRAGVPAWRVDFCQSLGSRASLEFARVAGRIRTAFTD
jgi:hypothetical protein